MQMLHRRGTLEITLDDGAQSGQLATNPAICCRAQIALEEPTTIDSPARYNSRHMPTLTRTRAMHPSVCVQHGPNDPVRADQRHDPYEQQSFTHTPLSAQLGQNLNGLFVNKERDCCKDEPRGI
jgi:hypothetical protein